MTLTKLKTYSTQISNLLAIIASVGGAIIYVETNYAHADDIKKILQQQEKQIQLLDQTQKTLSFHRLEYYDDRIERLRNERTTTESMSKIPAFNQLKKRSTAEIDSEIVEIKRRKEILKESLTAAPTNFK